MHHPFDIEHLSMIAKGFGLRLYEEKFGLYYMVDADRTATVNPYAQPDQISTDFSHHDLEDFLLTC
jgi:hypothetical protein